MHIKQVVKWGLPLLMLGVLGGCGQNKQSQSQSESTASSKQVKQSDQSSSDSSMSASTSSESDAATSTSDATSTTQSTASTAATSSSQSADSAQKNTTKSSSASTTTGTVSQASVLNQVYQQLSGQYARQDLLMQVSQGQPGIYTVQVQENHQSANMKSAGADPSTTPTVAWFQTNQQGQLLRSDNGGASYYVVGKVTQ
jgi:hypothetical protein